MVDILIVGGGPAGLTAAIYARRSGKSALVLEKAGFGGQIAYSPRVENYPGVGAVAGAALAEDMLTQALDQGADTDIGTVTALRPTADGWEAETEEGERYQARAVILAVGAEHRLLGLPGEEELVGNGVSYCAVCDGDFYAGRRVAVVGGGDSALQEALLLSDICEHVTVIHRRNTFRGEQSHQDRLFGRPNVEVLTPYVVSELLSRDGELCGLRLRSAGTGEERELTVDAVFVAMGRIPATKELGGLLPLDAAGYAAVDENCACPAPGLFVAGDCRAKNVRQLTTAVGDGATAALAACRWLESR